LDIREVEHLKSEKFLKDKGKLCMDKYFRNLFEIPKETLVEIKRILDNLPHEKKQCHDRETFEANKVNFLLCLLNQKEGSELISREKVIKIVK
jgi:hypothetical protein